MNKPTDILLCLRKLIKLYDLYLEGVRKNNSLTKMEMTIVSFLHNNPGKDTAADISELRMLPKGNISVGVESLIDRGFIERVPDVNDRRRIHLKLRRDSYPIVAEIERINGEYRERIFDGMSMEEKKDFDSMTERIMQNTMDALRGE